MAVVLRFYRLRIRTADDSADELVLSSAPSDTNPYIQGPPTGQGASVDLITGKATAGSYQIAVVDPLLGDGSRPVTAKLVDASEEQQLLSRKAFIERSDNGSTWDVLIIAGYVNRLAMTSAASWQFTIGDTLRIESSLTLFARAQEPFDAVSCIMGGPVRGGFGPQPDYGPWRMKVTDVVAGAYVEMSFVEGYLPVSLDNWNARSATPGYTYSHNLAGSDYEQELGVIARKFFVSTPTLNAHQIMGSFPDLEYRIQALDGTFVGTFQPLSAILPSGFFDTIVNPWKLLGVLGKFNIAWSGTGGQPAQPTVGALFGLYGYPIVVNDDNPVHIQGHPVDVITDLWDAAGVAWDAGLASTAKAALGIELQVALRITQQQTLQSLLETLCGIFGLGITPTPTAARGLVLLHNATDTAPTDGITIDDLFDQGPEPFAVDEQTIVNKLVLNAQHFAAFEPPHDGSHPTRPLDGVVATPVQTTVESDDMMRVGEHAAQFDLPGAIYQTFFLGPITEPGTTLEISGASYGVALARQLFARRQHGSLESQLSVLGSNFRASGIGDRFLVDIAFRPANNVRGGSRVVQVTGVNEVPAGQVLTVEDLGTTDQPSVTPTHTIATDTATDPARFAIVTLTNASALAADGDDVRVEMALGASPTAWGLVARISAAELVAGTSDMRTPRVDAGSVVNVRMRAEQSKKIPSSYSTPSNVTLDAIAAPTSLSATPVTGDGSLCDLAWTLADTTVPVVITLAEHTGGTAREVATLPPGSVQHRLAGLSTSVAYDVTVFHREAPPFAGVSSAATASFTAGSTSPTLVAPDDPRPFAGSVDPTSGGLVIDGSYGMDCVAHEFPSTTRFEEAVETAIGAGTYGSFADAPNGAMPSVQSGRTTWRNAGPNDGLRRQLRAYHTRPGATDSATTAVVLTKPWIALAPVDFPVPIPSDFALAANVQGDPSAAAAWISATWTPPAASQFDHMEYSVRARRTGDTDYGSPVIVVGTGNGVDRIMAQPGTDVEVTPITVTADGLTRNAAASPTTITIPLFAPPAPDITATATATGISYALTPDPATKYVLWWAKVYTDGTVPSSAITVENVGTLMPRLEPGGLVTAVGLTLDATNDWELATFVPYNANNERGTPIRLRTQRATPAAPSAPTAASNASVTSMSVTNHVTMPSSITNFDFIRAYRNGAVFGSDIARTAGASGVQSVTHSGLSPGETDSWAYSGVSSAGGESSKTTAFNATTGSGTIPTPSIAVGYSRVTRQFQIGVTPGAGTPGGVTWHLNADTVNPPVSEATGSASTSTALAFAQDEGPSLVTWYFTVWGVKSGWTDSAQSAVVSQFVPAEGGGF